MGKEVATPTVLHAEQETRRALLRVLMGGTRVLRKTENARVYLPPEEKEETVRHDGVPSEWTQRINRSVLYPFFSRGVRRAVAAIFRRPVALGDDVPEVIKQLWEDIDNNGNRGDVFFGRVVEDALGDAGMSYVLVDHPPVAPQSTLADVEAAGTHPYLVHVLARNVIGTQVDAEGGKFRYRTVRIRETYKARGEWEDEEREQIRVLKAAEGDATFATWAIYRKTDEANEDSWDLSAEGTMEPHVEIPLQPIYLGYVGPDEAVSPLEDLGFLNILHTQRESDISDSFRISLGAQLHRSGIKLEDAAKQSSIGARRLLVSEDPAAKAEWLERSGSAAGIALEAQDRLEARMRALAAEPHIRRTGDETATGRAIDEAEAKTEVQAWALAVQDFIEQCAMLLAKSFGEESGGSFTVEPPPRLAETDNEAFKLVLETRAQVGVPTKATILDILRRRGVLPDELDIEAEIEAAMIESDPSIGAAGRMRGAMRQALSDRGMSEDEIADMMDAMQAA